jgi:hypothetical protein
VGNGFSGPLPPSTKQRTMPISPIWPERMNSRPLMLCGEMRRCVPTWTTRPVARAAFTIARSFHDRVAEGLFNVNVGAGFDGGDHRQRVPMIGRADDGDIGLRRRRDSSR